MIVFKVVLKHFNLNTSTRPKIWKVSLVFPENACKNLIDIFNT